MKYANLTNFHIILSILLYHFLDFLTLLMRVVFRIGKILALGTLLGLDFFNKNVHI